MSSPAPKSPEMSEKSKKYDRQIRLWGENGQSLLEQAQICVINATALGSEILKGLILPGVGGFTIVDEKTVTEEDVGCNFFLELNCVGQSRAQACARGLLELNPDVRGDYVDESPEQLLEKNPDFFKNFKVVVATSLSEKTTIQLSNHLWELNVPLIVCRSIGFMGSLRIQIKELTVVESHPDNKSSDLRLVEPFPALEKHFQRTELSSKTPWIEILYHYLQIWRKSNEGRIPKTYKEKTELKDLIKAGMTADEENYEEAIRAVNSNLGGGKATSDIRKILDDDSCLNLSRNSTPFWVMAHAVRKFELKEGNGWLPVEGVIPDMTADTKSYIALQQVYKNQFNHDVEIVMKYVQDLIQELDLPYDYVSEQDIKIFCRNANSLHLVRGTKISDEYDKSTIANIVASGLENPSSLMEHYVTLRATERFLMEYGVLPGECQMEPDAARLKSCVSKLISDWGCSAIPREDLSHELCRYGGSEIHSVSAFIGGCVTQEVIKIVTRQFKPLHNTFIYDAITSSTETLIL
ncbi:nedd8-activating enzyme E1 regulatory subunit-like [Ctenocephalides felis]|uniref:nedd8-activating enzyme E1 regulatory subunit-like n=1 Tax=Ctenocephalides felis TaxID=7515 RepID=UPI000E6E3A4B|nr:nedd8-activating enzyme E1 regulatory subunit-like [Ctenocephalides felis]